MRHGIRWLESPKYIGEKEQQVILDAFEGMLDIYVDYNKNLIGECINTIEECKGLNNKDFETMKKDPQGKKILKLQKMINERLKNEFERFYALYFTLIDVKTTDPISKSVMFFITNQGDFIAVCKTLPERAKNFSFIDRSKFYLDKKGFFVRWQADMKKVIDAINTSLHIDYDAST